MTNPYELFTVKSTQDIVANMPYQAELNFCSLANYRLTMRANGTKEDFLRYYNNSDVDFFAANDLYLNMAFLVPDTNYAFPPVVMGDLIDNGDQPSIYTPTDTSGNAGVYGIYAPTFAGGDCGNYFSDIQVTPQLPLENVPPTNKNGYFCDFGLSIYRTVGDTNYGACEEGFLVTRNNISLNYGDQCVLTTCVGNLSDGNSIPFNEFVLNESDEGFICVRYLFGHWPTGLSTDPAVKYAIPVLDFQVYDGSSVSDLQAFADWIWDDVPPPPPPPVIPGKPIGGMSYPNSDSPNIPGWVRPTLRQRLKFQNYCMGIPDLNFLKRK